MSAELSAIPTASPVIADLPSSPKKKNALKVKKPVLPVPVSEPVVEDDEKEAQSEEEMITIPKAEYERLLAIAEKAGESVKKTPRARVSTKDADLRQMLRDGEKVFSSELVNTYKDLMGCSINLKMRATYVRESNGFVVRADDEEWNTNQMKGAKEKGSVVSHDYKKRGLIPSPTTLCSYFRFMMNHNDLSKQDKSTTCGFAKCFVIRNGKETRLATLL